MHDFLEKTFRLSESHTTIRTEILAGVTTFMTMSYIIFVQPAVLSTTGMDFQAVLASTCIVSAIGCFLMALLANYPIAVAPAMGHNFFFAFTVVAAMHYPWQVALGAVFISGIVFLLMSIWGVREALIHAIPDSLKRGIAVGIGLLITLVGLEWSGFLAANPVIFVFFFLDLFDSIGSLIGIAEQGGFMRDGKLPRAREVLLADAIGTSIAGLLGNSSVVSYIESAAGVAEGGRTGLASVVTGLLMLSGLFFAPIAQMIGEGYKNPAGLTLYPTVAPALIIVGAFMMRNVGRIEWNDPLEYIPAFITIVFIPFTFSITDGIAFGFISYVLLSVISGRYRKLHWLMVVFAALFVFRYAVL